MIVVGGTASNGMDISLSKLIGADLVKVETSKFPDGEIKVRVPEFDAKNAVIVQSTHFPQEKNMFELLLIAQELVRRGVNITAVVPYLAYARQNRSFYPGEAVSVNVVLDMFKVAGITSLITVNPHKSGPLMHFVGKVGIANAIDTIAETVKKSIENPIVMAPDKGGLVIAKNAAKVVGCEYTYVEKERDLYGAVSIKKTHGGDFRDKNVIIFDDIISTGGTIEQAARYAFDEGASTVSTAAVHLVMAGSAYEKLKNAGVTRIFGSNTVPFEHAEIIDIAPDIAKTLTGLGI
ncbi:MAG: ribose-phosphate diphosphokinase [Candidatus Marsarchaeota archaeon]|nr:ribose-phosphate diphosphokinase [Candidatus Marsarchaeota archaeon]MCL5413381.1 ribose-phosphate diphosphokinase [Candidatus Marsarchaeota archaeon]